MNEFVIDFVYEQKFFTGLVSPREQGSDTVYVVKAESHDQEIKLNIIASGCGDGKMEWCFSGSLEDGEGYDPSLLQEIGEAIEKYQTTQQ